MAPEWTDSQKTSAQPASGGKRRQSFLLSLRNSLRPTEMCSQFKSVWSPFTEDWLKFIEFSRSVRVMFCQRDVLFCRYSVNIISMELYSSYSLTSISDAAITMGMVLLNEAATSKGDVGKRRSKFWDFNVFFSCINRKL